MSFFRVNDWWRSKTALMMGMVYLFSAWFDISKERFLALAFFSCATTVGFASFGYLLNDLFDIKKDAIAGKRNFLAGKSPLLIILFFLCSGFFMLAPWAYLPFDKFSATLILAELILFIIYSAPPVRLKERGMAGIITDAVYAHALPVVLVSYTYVLAADRSFPVGKVVILALWQLLNGIRNILLHQAEDIEADKKAGVKNFVAKFSIQSFHATIRNLIFGEIFFSVVFFGVLFFKNPLFVLCTATILILSAIVYFKFRGNGVSTMLKSTWRYFPNNIYEKWLPPCNLIVLSKIHPSLAFILPLHLAFFNFDFYVQSFKTIYPLLRDAIVEGILFARKSVSYLANHTIYFFFLIFGIDLKKEDTSAIGYLEKRWKKKSKAPIATENILSEKKPFKTTFELLNREWETIQSNVSSRFSNDRKKYFVFVVCGTKEHIDALHYSLRALKQVSKTEIVVVTDSSRNEISVEHDFIVDVKTPAHFNHHQASIYLKTALQKILPLQNNYCYLDTDVVALDSRVDEIFNQFTAPITFAPDHCLMDKFSPSAVKCGCNEQYSSWQTELQGLFKKYKHLTRQHEDETKKAALLKYFDEIKKDKFRYALITLKFWLSLFKFKLHSDAILDKRKHTWFDKNGNAIIYEREDNAIALIESTTDYRCDKTSLHRWTIYGHEVFDCRCNHLQEQIQKTFNIKIADSKWQHWNGGVFLFNEQSRAFLDSWHEKTLQIFENPEWKTRDQGTLIATVWENNLQNHPTLPVEFNLIADYNHLTMVHKGGLNFDINETQLEIRPHFIHVYHHWADKKWDVWQEVEKKTGIAVEHESDTVNSLWIGKKLSALEMLTLHSFADKGHKFKLWLYDEIENELPKEIEVGDASLIIPALDVFSYKNKNKYGHGKGSYAGFSDIFRYKLLYENGGWWTDMDVTCLKSFDFDKPYFFRSHHELKVVGNVMKIPKRSELMKRCFEEAFASVNEHNTDWHKPIDILNRNISELNLEGYIYKNVSNNDRWDITSRYIWHTDLLPDNWYFIHWQNEEWRARNVSKNDFYYRSALAELMNQYKLAQMPASTSEKIFNSIKHFKYLRHLFAE